LGDGAKKKIEVTSPRVRAYGMGDRNLENTVTPEFKGASTRPVKDERHSHYHRFEEGHPLNERETFQGHFALGSISAPEKDEGLTVF
jgi:hypothetical protein